MDEWDIMLTLKKANCRRTIPIIGFCSCKVFKFANLSNMLTMNVSINGKVLSDMRLIN